MTTRTLSDAEVASIKETIQAFTRCLEAQEFAKWVTYWAKDGLLMPPGHPRVVGHDALVDFMRKNFGNVQSVALTDWRVMGEGGLAIVTTNVDWTAQAEKQPSEAMKQLLVLSKDAAGKWLLKTVIFNTGV